MPSAAVAERTFSRAGAAAPVKTWNHNKDTTMESRELYRQKYEAQMHEWSARLDTMKAQTEKLTVQAKLDVKPHLDSVNTKFEAAKARLGEIADATDEKWNDLVSGVDHAWSELKAAAEGAHDAVKAHQKS
jgi:hypothetical protein